MPLAVIIFASQCAFFWSNRLGPNKLPNSNKARSTVIVINGTAREETMEDATLHNKACSTVIVINGTTREETMDDVTLPCHAYAADILLISQHRE